jgi:hypothetical protein
MKIILFSMKKSKNKSLFDSFTEPFNLFYLGFLASVGLTLGSVMLINVIRRLLEFVVNFDLLIYSRIVLAIFYLFFFVYTYRFLNMGKNISLRNGFLLFAIISVLAQIYLWLI